MSITSLPPSPDAPKPSDLRLIGDDVMVACADGIDRTYLNLDSAATTPALRAVGSAVEQFLPWYSSVHRGAGLKSQVTTAAYEGARAAVASFVGAREDDAIIFTRNTTEAINQLSFVFGADVCILTAPTEHHANMLPWRRHRVVMLPFPHSPEQLLSDTAQALADAHGRIALVAVTAASNVTGEVWPVRELAELAHGAGAQIFVDAAQLAPHRTIDMGRDDIDYLAVSGHKLYAPYGSGTLIARPDRLGVAEPFLYGGGAVADVTLDDVTWSRLPERFEAGSPNAVGAVALGVACDMLSELGMNQVAQHEQRVAQQLWDGIAKIDGVHRLRLWKDGTSDRLGLATLVVDGYSGPLLATIFGAEYGIGVRSGRFCAHPLVAHLLEEASGGPVAADLGAPPSGAVRASISLTTSAADVERFLTALARIVRDGPQLDYRYVPGTKEYIVQSDPRSWPKLPFRVARRSDQSASSSVHLPTSGCPS